MKRCEEADSATSPVLGLIHTVAGLVPLFDGLVRELGGSRAVAPLHQVDEALLQVTRRIGLSKPTVRHLFSHAVSAQESGAQAILVTCSSVGPAVELIRPLIDVPVLRVDDAMVAKALSIGSRIGVIATLESTLTPTVELIRQRAAARSADVSIGLRLCEGAFDAAQQGDQRLHDELVTSALMSVSASSDVVVMAQASMARVLAELPVDATPVPVLTSPALAVQAALEVLDGEACAPPTDRPG